jgi:hypothetical protein
MKQSGEIGYLADHGDAQAASQDSGMTLGASVLDHDAGEAVQIDGKQLHHRGFPSNQNDPVGGQVRLLPGAELP